MKKKFQYFIIVIFSLMLSSSFSQISEADNPIFLVANGSGISKEDARQNALKSAIIYALNGMNTSGNSNMIDFQSVERLIPLTNSFLNYTISNDDPLPSGIIASTIKVKIDADRFTNVLKTVGINLDFRGGKIALQIKQQIINEQSETASISRMIELLDEPMHSVFDYKIKSSFPKSLDDTNKEWAIPLKVQVVTNKEIDNCSQFFFHTLSEFMVDPEEAELYEKMDKMTFPIRLNYQGSRYEFRLRKLSSVYSVRELVDKWEYYLWNFKVQEGTNEYARKVNMTLENSNNYGERVSNESINRAKIDYQFTLNATNYQNSDELDIVLPKALQLVGEFSWFDKKTLTELETIGNYTVISSGFTPLELRNVEVDIGNISSEPGIESNSNQPLDSEIEIFTAVEQQAEFPGGPGAWGRYLNKTLKYPSSAQKKNIGGRVFVSFVVNIDGTIQDVQVLKGVGYGCDEEAVRVVKSMPRWNPGKQSGRAVRSRFTQPITFVLSE